MNDITNSEEERLYVVLINDEEQYSLWLQGKDVPSGWSKLDIAGNKKLCMDYIDRVWLDMRPASLRRRMDKNAVN